MPKSLPLIPTLESIILTIRNQKVIIDADLATLYGVPTRSLNQALKRNADRFPKSFAFQLTAEEKTEVITNCDHLQKLKFASSLPWAFTEHGALMAANVLNSPQATTMSVALVETFIKLRQLAFSIGELSQKVAALERGFLQHGEQFEAVFDAIRQLLEPPEPTTREIGFHAKEE